MAYRIWCSLPDATSQMTIENGRARIDYYYNGVKYNIHLPYNSRAASRMIDSTVYLEMTDAPDIDITQQPGLPYLTTAQQMGGVRFRVINSDGDAYRIDTPLFYLK
jgi:hypothetical protein